MATWQRARAERQRPLASESDGSAAGAPQGSSRGVFVSY